MLQCQIVATLVFGCGYVGSRLIQELLYQGREVVALDNFFATDRRAISAFGQAPGFRFIEGSIVDRSAVERALDLSGDPDELYLLAAQASAHPAAAPPEYTEEVNLRGPRVVLDLLVKHNLDAPLVFASSMRVYGSPLPPIVSEMTPYGVFHDLSHLSKCYAEKLLEMYGHLYHLRLRVVRLGLVYGVAPVMKTDPRFMTAPNLFCLRAALGEPIEIRTLEPLALLHVDDAVQALMLAAERRGQPGYQVYNAVSDVSTLPHLAAIVRDLAARRDRAVIVHDRTSADAAAGSVPTIESGLARLGFVARRQLAEGMAETFDHFLVRGQ